MARRQSKSAITKLSGRFQIANQSADMHIYQVSLGQKTSIAQGLDPRQHLAGVTPRLKVIARGQLYKCREKPWPRFGLRVVYAPGKFDGPRTVLQHLGTAHSVPVNIGGVGQSLYLQRNIPFTLRDQQRLGQKLLRPQVVSSPQIPE